MLFPSIYLLQMFIHYHFGPLSDVLNFPSNGKVNILYIQPSLLSTYFLFVTAEVDMDGISMWVDSM